MTDLRDKYIEVVNHFGNQHKTAEALGCSQPLVWKWVNEKSDISPILALRAQKESAGKFKASDLAPELAEFAGMIIH